MACEVLCPGSVGLVSLRGNGRDSTGGFIRRCKPLKQSADQVLVALAGKAAVELYYADPSDGGCQFDINKACEVLRTAISENGTRGLGMVNLAGGRFFDMSENYNARIETVVHAELERYLHWARDILLRNRGFLEEATETLLEKETILYSDIRVLRESVHLVADKAR